jgi:hypothetical protein
VLVSRDSCAAAELGRLAELAAKVTEDGDAEDVERQVAAALASLRDRIGAGGTERLLAAAADIARPLSRRVAVLAHLHLTLAGP